MAAPPSAAAEAARSSRRSGQYGPDMAGSGGEKIRGSPQSHREHRGRQQAERRDYFQIFSLLSVSLCVLGDSVVNPTLTPTEGCRRSDGPEESDLCGTGHREELLHAGFEHTVRPNLPELVPEYRKI